MLQLSGSRIVVSPDTGPLHMAVGMNIPTIGLYGFSDPRRCGPYRYRDLLIDKYNDYGEENSPITRATRKGKMGKITPQEVIDKIDLALKRY
jgi:heptosyltransferase I